jgi:hypothetical protein
MESPDILCGTRNTQLLSSSFMAATLSLYLAFGFMTTNKPQGLKNVKSSMAIEHK